MPQGEKFTDQLFSWFESNGRRFWWRDQLNELSPFQVLVTELLLWKTRAETVDERGHSLVTNLEGPEDVIATTQPQVRESLRPFGLYNRRSKYLYECSEKLLSQHGGSVPKDEEKLLGLPGVGQYIARATLTFAFERPHIPIDPNTRPVLSKHYGIEVDSIREVPVDVHERLVEIVDDRDPVAFTWALIDYGAAHY